MTLKNSKGFTLVEMLVVIAIISVLAAALFPAISNALSSASATALKQKGRGIWVAITSANMEREPLNLTALWPYECSEDPQLTPWPTSTISSRTEPTPPSPLTMSISASSRTSRPTRLSPTA